MVLLRAAAIHLHAMHAVCGKHHLRHLRAGDARGRGNVQVFVDLAVHVPRRAHADDHGDDDQAQIAHAHVGDATPIECVRRMPCAPGRSRKAARSVKRTKSIPKRNPLPAASRMFPRNVRNPLPETHRIRRVQVAAQRGDALATLRHPGA